MNQDALELKFNYQSEKVGKSSKERIPLPGGGNFLSLCSLPAAFVHRPASQPGGHVASVAPGLLPPSFLSYRGRKNLLYVVW